MRTLYQIFDDAQTLLKLGWVSGHYAVDKQGKDVSPQSDLAVAYCEMGGIQAICWYEIPDHDTVAYNKLVKFCQSILNMANTGVLNSGSVENRNDTNDQELAIKMMENAKNYIINSKQMGLNYIPGWFRLKYDLVDSKEIHV